jgi:nickel-dependent lactate racemase
VFWPSTPAPIGDEEIRSAVDAPAGQRPLRELAAGKRRPLIILDDLTRPTPADRVVPHLLRHLDDAGVPRSEVRIMLGSGAHGVAPIEAVVRKAGPEAAECRAVVHDAWRRGVRVGTTSFGSPVIVDSEVAASDLLIGVGGVYPQHSVGFGGGSKLVLGVLGRRSIVSLHYSHPSVAGSYDLDNDFRRDLDEMARIAGLSTIVTIHVDALRRPVRVICGDPASTYADSAAFSRTAYAAPRPDGYDVVVSNAYPMDVSLTFSRSKGLAPLAYAADTASKVLIAACSEGLGLHRLFPYLNGPRFETQVHQLRRLATIHPGSVPRRLMHKGRAAMRRLVRTTPAAHIAHVAQPARRQAFAGELKANVRRPVHLWTPLAPRGSLPDVIPDFQRHASWHAVIDAAQAEQQGRSRVRVAVYPCAPLHCLEQGEAVRVAV